MCVCVCVCVLVTQSCLTLCNPWDFSGKNTGVVKVLDLPDTGNEPGSPALQADSSSSEPPGKPI